MQEYSLLKIDAVKGKCKFYKLKHGDYCWFDDFENNLEGQYQSELNMIYKYMDRVSNNAPLPINKFKKLNKGMTGLAEYEFKSKHLRVYCFHLPETGKIVVLGGFKNSQKSDLSEFKKNKDRYLEYIENEKRRAIKK